MRLPATPTTVNIEAATAAKIVAGLVKWIVSVEWRLSLAATEFWTVATSTLVLFNMVMTTLDIVCHFMSLETSVL